MWLKILCVALGGAIGAVARVELARGIEYLVERLAPAMRINLGLLAVNLLGCFAFGIIWAVLAKRGQLDSLWGWGLLGGAMGAFTTFSTFAFEASAIMQKPGGAIWAPAQIILHNALGIGLVFAGLAAGRWYSGWGT